MLTSIFQAAPAETTNFMIAGYVVIFGVILLYIISLVIRTRTLKRDIHTLTELEQEKK